MHKRLVSRGLYLATDVRYIQSYEPKSDNLIQSFYNHIFRIDLVIDNSISYWWLAAMMLSGDAVEPVNAGERQ